MDTLSNPRALDPEPFETEGKNAYNALGVATRRHKALSKRAMKLLIELHPGCEVDRGEALFSGKVDESGKPTYYRPDVMVVCQEELHPKDDTLVTNPVVLVEVISKTTCDVDVQDKVQDYTAMESLEAYFVIDQYQRMVVAHIRDSQRAWQTHMVNKGRLKYGAELFFEVDALFDGLL